MAPTSAATTPRSASNSPAGQSTDASVRCFADPAAHSLNDRNPSCSISLTHGAWNCHACGAPGGAFDAATVWGYSDRGAIGLMVAYGLTEHRAYRHAVDSRRAPHKQVRPRRSRPPESVLKATEDDIATWQANLASDRVLIARLAQHRGWRYPAMRTLCLGVDRGRITIPTRDHAGRLIGLLRYQPWPRPGEAKLRAARGSRRTLLPHPAAEPSQSILLVEGEPDMIAARSHGIPAIAVPGVDGWRPQWASWFTGRQVAVVMDCDKQGRAAACEIVSDLSPYAHAETIRPRTEPV